MCFGLILQLVGFGSILAYQYGYLSLNNRQSIFDLSCLYNDIELRIYYDEKAIREIEYVTIDEYEKK